MKFPCFLALLALVPFTAVAFPQSEDALLEGEAWAICYSGFREGQHPDRGEGAVNPSRAEITEDLRLLVDEDFRLLRMYDSGENSALTLEIIKEEKLPLQMLLGVWLSAELSNHEGCAWLTEPIPEAELAANKIANQQQVDQAIALAKAYPEIVAAINVGNEALVGWTDHLVSVEAVIAYVRQVKTAVATPVTKAENYEWWIQQGAELAAELDFVGVHTYPVWENRAIDEGMSDTIENMEAVQAALPDATLAILEAGWATTASEFGERAGEAQQVRYYQELKAWAEKNKVTTFFFSAFDEPWKGNPADPLGAEKHWGIFFVDRSPKAVLRD